MSTRIWLHEVLQHEMALYEDTRGPSTFYLWFRKFKAWNLLSRFPFFFIYERHNFPLRKTQFCIYFKGGVSSPNVNQRRWSRASQLIWPHVKPPPTLQITILCIFPAGWWVMNISTIPDKLGTLILTSFIQSLLGFLRQFVLLPTAFFKWVAIYAAILIGR